MIPTVSTVATIPTISTSEKPPLASLFAASLFPINSITSLSTHPKKNAAIPISIRPYRKGISNRNVLKK